MTKILAIDDNKGNLDLIKATLNIFTEVTAPDINCGQISRNYCSSIFFRLCG